MVRSTANSRLNLGAYTIGLVGEQVTFAGRLPKRRDCAIALRAKAGLLLPGLRVNVAVAILRISTEGE